MTFVVKLHTKRKRNSFKIMVSKIKGGSDISGTLSNLHCCIKNICLTQFFGPKPSQLFAEA